MAKLIIRPSIEFKKTVPLGKLLVISLLLIHLETTITLANPVVLSELSDVSEKMTPDEPKKPFKIVVYPWNDHLGRPATLEWTPEEEKSMDCKEIPKQWQGKVRSINTNKNCVRLYSHNGCQGISKVVKVGSPSHNRLSDICFHKKPTSLRPCTADERKS